MAGILSDFAHWLLQVLLWLPKRLWADILAGLAAIITAIPVPSWISSIPGWLNGMPSGIWWWIGWLHFGSGLGIVISAYVLRFLIRRIPFVGG